MPSDLPSAPPSKVPALTAFLDGVEPRAWAFALGQCGDPDRATAALESALTDFVPRARDLPLPQWPLQFWASLLNQPSMAIGAQDSGPILAQIPPGPRAALLLRLIVGLDFEHAAHVFDVSVAAYEQALRTALAHPALDDAQMQALREDLHEQVQHPSSERRQQLLSLREQALSIFSAAPSPPAQAKPVAGRKRWWLIGLLVVVVLALAAIIFRPVRSLIAPGQTEALPAEDIAPPPSLTDTVIVTHPDYAQLANPADDEIAQQLPFLSWMAATRAPMSGAGPQALVAAAPDSFGKLPADLRPLLSSAQGAWPTLDQSTRDALLRHAADWRSRTPEQRTLLRQRLREWDQLAAPDRGSRRSPFVAWQRLSEADRQRVRDIARNLAALPLVDQQALQAEFAALPADDQNLWWMGPALGQELVPVASLFAFVPESRRPALLDAVHSLDAQSRADLAVLAPRLVEARRQQLIEDLLAAPPEQRAGLIRQRLGQ
ncbi:MAG: DUF3106 domain-containing protein [Arenimonas sp.]|nr:DUF3106 domain-containing protein [Arenimonas sp.]